MRKSGQLILATTSFCAIAGFFLAWTNSITKTPIEEARRAEMIDALRKVLPECDNDTLSDVKTLKDDKGREWTFHIARMKGSYVGAAFRVVSPEGYGGPIETLVGVRADASVNGIEIIRAEKETPGLGAKIKEPAFLKQFGRHSASDLAWAAIVKDGGQIDAITGATISSRAVTKSVGEGLRIFANNAALIADAEH
jgi:electron transport complex protein RnfG